MSGETPKDYLRKHPFVEGMTERQLEQFASLAREVWFESDRILFHENEECGDFYLIISGSVSLEIAPPTGVFRVDVLSAGDEFGWSSVMGQGTVYQARVVEKLHALAFDASELRALCEKDTGFGYALMRRLLSVVADRLQVTRMHVMDSYWPVAKRAGA
jgi:CRP-like cAMP-binding protein